MTRAAGTLEAGQTFADRFRVERPLAEGGMGQLYVVTNVATGHRCALKLLGAEGCFDDEIRSRFLAEARNTPSDASDHIVKVHDAGVADGRPWIAMELLDGATLHERVARHGALSWAELREVFAQLCHGLAAAHERGVVHRDLKPENVFLLLAKSARGGEFVKVLDFGVAKALDPRLARGTASIVIGTQGWWAPEQVFGGTISPATDVWALGLLAYWCLTERQFFDAGMPQTSMLKSAATRAAEHGVGPRIPQGFDAWFACCVAWEPTQRFRDAGAAWRALDAVLKRATAAVAPTMVGVPVHAAPAYVPPPTLRPMEVRQRTERAPRPRSKKLPLVAFVAVGALAVTGMLGDRWGLIRGLAKTSARRPLSERPDLQSFVMQWGRALGAISRHEYANIAPFYAPLTRFRGSANPATPAEVARYWPRFFYNEHATLVFDWTRATWQSEPFGSQPDSHSACNLLSGGDPDVTLVRIRVAEDGPHASMPTRDGSRCRHIVGNYLLRLRRVQGAWRICHDTLSRAEAICPSCPAVSGCSQR